MIKHQIIINVFPVAAAIHDSKLVNESTREHYPAVPCYLESDISDSTTDTSALDDTMPGPRQQPTGSSSSNDNHEYSTNLPPGIDPADPTIHTGSVRRQAQHINARVAANTTQQQNTESPKAAAQPRAPSATTRSQNPWTTSETLRTPPAQTGPPPEPEVRDTQDEKCGQR